MEKVEQDRGFFLCPQPGCNRKYKSDKRWFGHVTGDHGMPADSVALPERSHVPKTKSGCATNRRLFQKAHFEAARKMRQLKRDAEARAEEEIRKRYGHDYLAIQDRVRENPEDCAICMDAPRDAACVPCGHAYFCHACLEEWHRERGNCPYCRKQTDVALKLFL